MLCCSHSPSPVLHTAKGLCIIQWRVYRSSGHIRLARSRIQMVSHVSQLMIPRRDGFKKSVGELFWGLAGLHRSRLIIQGLFFFYTKTGIEDMLCKSYLSGGNIQSSHIKCLLSERTYESSVGKTSDFFWILITHFGWTFIMCIPFVERVSRLIHSL